MTRILINTINKAKQFNQEVSQIMGDVDLVSGRYVIDAKSILGIFSLDLSKPVELRMNSSYPEDDEKFKNIVDKYKANVE